MRTARRGRTVTFTIESETIRSARATADDLLACLTAADRSAAIGAETERRTAVRTRER